MKKMLSRKDRPSLEKIEELAKTTKGWMTAVLLWDEAANHYYERSEEEVEWIAGVERILKDLSPPMYREGAHPLHPSASFMGEDICCVDGNLTTANHQPHKECGGYSVVERGDGWWCCQCDEEVVSERSNGDWYFITGRRV